MATVNLLKNRKRFLSEVLDVEHNENILAGEADGEVMVVDRYNEMFGPDSLIDEKNNSRKKISKRYHMSLFPTTHRIVVYQARGWLAKDRFAQLPLRELEKISFLCAIKDGKAFCVTEFIVPDDSMYPSIIFKIDIDDVFTFDCYRALISSISKTARVAIDDCTDYNEMVEAGLVTPKKKTTQQ